MSDEPVPFDDAIVGAAIDWTIRARDPSFRDWDAMTRWLEADARHSDCFAEVSLWDADLAEALGRSRAAAGGPRPSWHRAPAPWLSLAAGIVLTIGGGSAWLVSRHGPGPVATIATIATGAGQRRELALGTGIEIAVAPETRLTADPATRRVHLLAGQATFTVRHDPAHPIVVEVGDATVTDVGTVFDVTRRDGRTAVAVKEGEVRVAAGGAPIELAAGHRIDIVNDHAVIQPIDPVSVGAWRTGIRTYRDASVGDVLADIRRDTGVEVAASDAVRRMAFAGSIRIEPDTGRTLARLAPALGLTATKSDGQWRLRAPPSPRGD